jgi:Fe-coproporphyrin III synthase
MEIKLHGSIIVTYRCNAKCQMCNVWQYPSNPSEEISLEEIRKLPRMFFVNVTGGEPFIRQDLPEIIAELRNRSRRIVISTNGYFTQRITQLCKRFPDLGIRISIEGLKEANDLIRGMPGGYERTQDTLKQLQTIGLKDIGFAMTVQDTNHYDLEALYQMASKLDYEFATATLHNSHYFRKLDNKIENKEAVISDFKKLIVLLLKSRKIKEWFRAYFNYGLINFIEGKPRFLPCEMGEKGFFVDPYGDVLACNGMNEKISMGNLKKQAWDEIWQSETAKQARTAVKKCTKNCWMIGSAAPAMLHHPLKPIKWVLKNKLRTMLGKEIIY